MVDSIQKAIILQEFKKLDKNENGLLDYDELRPWLIQLAAEINLQLTENDIEKLLSTLDVNKDGIISVEDFLNLFDLK
jgi:Ca2+-binding EF-hand superfamily protein